MDTNELQILSDTVVKGGYCIGCGVCAVVSGSSVKMELNKNGCWQPVIPGEQKTSGSIGVLKVCPFYINPLNEDVIAKELFAKNCAYDERIGYYSKIFEGYVIEDGYRELGSSGGMVTWLIAQLFERKLIDGVIHVHNIEDPDEHDHRLFKIGISYSIEEIKRFAKSKYYPVELSETLSSIKEKNGEFAIVGVPCFIKAVRLLAKKEKIFKSKIKYHIGLVCGHLKSSRFAEMLAWQNGIVPGGLQKIDFREKLFGHRADDYVVMVEGRTKEGKVKKVEKSISELYGYDWGMGLFKYEACDYCDDVFSETADITLGNAWLSQFVVDSKGTNVVVARDSVFLNIVKEGITSGKVYLKPLSLEDAIKSQRGGLRHRREGLAYRLALKDQAHLWRPTKRVNPDLNQLDKKSKAIFDLRMSFQKEGFIAFSKALAFGRFEVFRKLMSVFFKKYDFYYRESIYQRCRNKLAKIYGICKEHCDLLKANELFLVGQLITRHHGHYLLIRGVFR